MGTGTGMTCNVGPDMVMDGCVYGYGPVGMGMGMGTGPEFKARVWVRVRNLGNWYVYGYRYDL